MKCPNCGGEVSVNDVKCPYCGTPNPEGIRFQEEVHKRRSFNEYLRAKIKEQMRMPLLQRVMNLSIFFLFLLFMIQLFVSLGVYMAAEGNLLGGLIRPDDYEEQMAGLYAEGSYGELDAFMTKYNIEPADYPEYTQMYLLDHGYQDFLFHSMSCMEALEQGIMPDDYHLEYTFRAAEELLNPYIPAYPDIYPENQKILDTYQEEAIICLAGMFHLSREEVLTLVLDTSYHHSSYEAVEQLLKKAEENLTKEGFANETDD